MTTLTECACGRQEDDAEMKKLQAEIFENFQERIQLRRALLELEEQNALNALEIKRRQAEVLIWKKQEESKELPKYEEGRPLSAVPTNVRKQFKDIQMLKGSTDCNNKRKELMLNQLQQNMARGKSIRASISARIKFQDKQNFLELLIKNHILEQTNVELELQLQIQEKTIMDMQNLVLTQKKLLEENKIDDGSAVWGNVENVLPEPATYGPEEELDMKGYDINAPLDEEEEMPFEEDEEFETRDLLLATSQATADIDNSQAPFGFMLQGKGLIRRQQQESTGKPENIAKPAEAAEPVEPTGLGLNQRQRP